MNAIVVLCHFCEQHGPSVVMCTQPFRQPHPRPTTVTSNTIRKTSSHNTLYFGGGGDATISMDGSMVTQRRVINNEFIPGPSRASPVGAVSQGSNSDFAVCRACTFTIRDESGLITEDRTANTSYVSTQRPSDSQLCTFVVNASLRSLSSEVLPGTEGAFYFGDELNGHTISYNFYVKDAQARGLQSRFSFLVIAWDRNFLLSLWPFLVRNLERMANRIQLAASIVYEAETSNASGAHTTSDPSVSTSSVFAGMNINRTNMNSATPVAALRHVSTASLGNRGSTLPVPIPQAMFMGQPIATAHVSVVPPLRGSIPSHLDGLHRQRRVVSSDMRSLADLTKDNEVFYRIHAWFTWLLRAAGRRWTTELSHITIPNEDILLEQEDRQSGIIPLPSGNSNIVRMIAPLLVGDRSAACGSPMPSSSSSVLTSVMVGNSQMAVGQFFSLTDGSNQAESELALLVLTRLYRALGPTSFGTVVQHVAVGNQLVVQPLKDNRLGPLVVAAFAKLLPKGCLKQMVSSEYVPAFRCNLLALTAEAEGPSPDWSPDETVLFMTVFQTSPPPRHLQPPSTHQVKISSGLLSFVDTLRVKVCATLPSIDPQFNRIKAHLSSESSDPSALSSITSSTTLPTSTSQTSSFVNRVVQVVSLMPPLPPSTLELALAAIRREWIDRARLLFSFKRCQVPTMHNENRWEGVLGAIDCSSPENAAIARFWQGALSQYSRQNPCHTRRHSTPSSSATSRRGSRCSSVVDLNTAMAAFTLND